MTRGSSKYCDDGGADTSDKLEIYVMCVIIINYYYKLSPREERFVQYKGGEIYMAAVLVSTYDTLSLN